MDNAEKLKGLFGVNVNELTGHALEEPDYPDQVPGRVLHIDGDFLAYQVSADNEKSIDTMMHNHDVAVEVLRLLAGAEKAVSHLTASHGDKGKRFELAIQKEYQASRKGKDKPVHLHTIKSWMERARGAVNHVDQEADDGLCQANWEAVKAGTPHLAVLTSKDKDLQMCQGTHLDWDTGDLEVVDGFGYVDLDRSKSSPKIVGKGNAYFWAQLLTGDAADSIQGLPGLTGAVLDVVKPLKGKEVPKDVLKALRTALSEDAPETKRKLGKCGPVVAFEILKHLQNDKDAFEIVKALYKAYGEEVGFKHWDTGEEVQWNKIFISEAQLLWMRREKGELDILNYLGECV